MDHETNWKTGLQSTTNKLSMNIFKLNNNSKGGKKGPEDILLYIPNLIGYGRLCLLILAYFFIDFPHCFLTLYCLSISLDLIDGWSARIFNQVSAFGAWFDVVLDNVSRGCVWTNIFSWGWIIVSIEWITYVCNHQAGSKWREDNAKVRPNAPIVPPKWLIKVMENGFKNPLGTWVIFGLHVLPVWIYAMQHGITDLYISYALTLFVLAVLVGGRIMCFACELWCIKKHLIELLQEDI